MTRWKPPHPARSTPPPAHCPNGRPYRTAALAAAALIPGYGNPHLTPTPCQCCRGWHNQPPKEHP